MVELVLAANALLWLVLLGHFALRPGASVFHPAAYYLFFHGLVFVVRPLWLTAFPDDGIYAAYRFWPGTGERITVLLAAMLGLVAFYIPCLQAAGAAPRLGPDRITELERGQLIGPFLLVAALLVPPGVLSALDGWHDRAADHSTMIRDAATGHTIHTTGTGYWDEFQLVLGPLAVMAAWLFRLRWWSLLPLAGFVVLRAGTGGRWAFVMACASVALLALHQQGRRVPRPPLLLAAAGLVLLFHSVGTDRGAAVRALFGAPPGATQTAAPAPGLLTGMDFANLEYFEYLVHTVPHRTGGYGYFLDNLQVLTEPVPRVLWPDKPVGPPLARFSLWDHGTPIGMTYSLPGNGWLQLGYAGVAAWCALFGWGYGRAYAWFQRAPPATLRTLGYLLALPISVQVFRDGVLLSLIKTHAWFLLPVVLTYAVARLTGTPLADELRRNAAAALRRRSAAAVGGAGP